MLTGTKFNRYQNNLDLRRGFIVEIDDGTNTWYFSNIEIDGFSAGHVHKLLDDDFLEISEEVNIFTREWAVSDITVTASNRRYKRDGSQNWLRLSDELGSIAGSVGVSSATLKIYLLIGETATGLSDCLERFSGTVVTPPSYDGDKITITAINSGAYVDKKLPTSRMVDVYPLCPDEVKWQYIPLLYGIFSYDDSLALTSSANTSKGMAKGLPTVKGLNPKFVVSDHTLHALTTAWLKPLNQKTPPFSMDSPTLNTNDSGYGTVQPTSDTVYAKVKPNDGEDYYSYSWAASPIVARSSGWIKDFVDSSGIQWAESAYNFDSEIESFIMGLLKSNADINRTTKIQFIYTATLGSGVTNSSSYIELLYYDGSPDVGVKTTGSALTIDGSSHTVDGATNPDIPSNKNARLILHVHLVDSVGTNADSTINNYNMVYLPYTKLALIIPYVLHESDAFTSSGDANGSNPNEDVCYVECEGREYGSWISSRSSNYASGDCIEDPAGIIESLLRDELGLGNADIDLPSFIDAENTSVKARINIIEREQAFDIIKRLAEQSTFAFVWTASGKARAIDLRDSSPSTDRTIPVSHIVDPEAIGVSKTEVVAYTVEYRHRWLGEYGDYYQRDGSGSADPIAQVEWPNIADGSADTVHNHLVNVPTVNGLWQQPRIKIEFTTKGFSNADLEIGDYIELSSDVDPYLTCFGTSWSGLQFLVVGLSQTADGTRIKAINLY